GGNFTDVVVYGHIAFALSHPYIRHNAVLNGSAYGSPALNISPLAYIPLIGKAAAFFGLRLYSQRNGAVPFPVRRAGGLSSDNGRFHIHNGNLRSVRSDLRRFVIGSVLVCISSHTVVIEGSGLICRR